MDLETYCPQMALNLCGVSIGLWFWRYFVDGLTFNPDGVTMAQNAPSTFPAQGNAVPLSLADRPTLSTLPTQ